MPRIGLISDTHGLLRPEALSALAGCQHIIHGGDIGHPEVLSRLAALAPVSAVRGNNDRQSWADAIPLTRTLVFGGVRIHVLHDVAELALDPAAEGMGVVVSGHSHKPSVVERDGVLFVNPGSAGPRRFKLPVSVAELVVNGAHVEARIVALALDAAVPVSPLNPEGSGR